MYPKEINSMSKRFGMLPVSLVNKTVKSVKIYKYVTLATWILFGAAFYFIVGWFNASTTVALRLVCGSLLGLCIMPPLFFTVITARLILDSLFDPEGLAIDMLVEEEREYNEIWRKKYEFS